MTQTDTLPGLHPGPKSPGTRATAVTAVTAANIVALA